MHIILFVAGVARHRKFCRGHIFLGVAAVATNLCVSARQRKPRVAAMIESDARPADRRMATATVLGKAAKMHIVAGMAGDAGLGRPNIGTALVAGFAGHDRMKTYQGVAGGVMIKLDVLLPGGGAVASLACCSQFGLMHVLCLVTAYAGGGNFGAHVRTMAICAQGLGVSALQGKFRLFVMVEFCALPFFDGMAVLAGRAETRGVYVLDSVAIIAGG